MNKCVVVMIAIIVLALSAPPVASAGEPQHAKGPSADTLFDTISALDTATFDAFNHCSDGAQLQKHASYFAPDVEFYHDTGGVTWTRQEMIDKTKRNVCGNFRRELVPGSLEVFPIKGFGAIEQGVHRFCPLSTDECDGMADFVIIWRHQGDAWQITRVLSYGHHAIEQD